MMVSMATAVFPVWRSPMISSRWPRPMGIMASMALIPVCSGSFTGRRFTTPGASLSVGMLQQLARHDFLEAVDPGNPVSDRQDGPHLALIDARLETLDFLSNDLADFVSLDLHHRSPMSLRFSLCIFPVT